MIDTARDPLIRLTTVARRFGVSYQTVRKWVTDGKLAAERAGGSWYTTENAVREYTTRSTQEEIDRIRSANSTIPTARKAVVRKSAAITSAEHLHHAAMFRNEGYSV